MKYLTLLIPPLLLCACSIQQDPAVYLKQWHTHDVSSAGFDHCKGYGCRLVDHVVIDDKTWRRIDRYFKRPAKTATEERSRLGPVIGEFERIVGPITNTHTDVKDTFYSLGDDQLDCVDESVNTTTYLLLLQERGHLRFHDVTPPTSRPPLVAGSRWPHQSAVVKDKETQIRYAVDSWFENSGVNAHVVPVDEWFYNWSPRKAKETLKDK